MSKNVENIKEIESKFLVSSQMLSDLSLSEKIIKQLDCSFKNVIENFFEIGKHLCELKELHSRNDKCLPVSDFFVFCKERYGFAERTVYNFINVYKACRTKSNELDKRFETLPFTNIVNLLPLKDDLEFAESFNGLTSRQVKNVVKKLTASDVVLSEEVTPLAVSLIKELVKDTELDFQLCNPSDYELIDKKCHLHPAFAFKLNGYICYLTLTKPFNSFGWRESYSGSLHTLESMIYSYECFTSKEIVKSIKSFFKEFLISYKEFIKKAEEKTDEPKVKKPNVTGIAARLGLRKKDIPEYVNNISNYERVIADIPEIGLRIRALKDVPGIYLMEYPQTNEFFSNPHSIVGINFRELSNAQIIEHMNETDAEINSIIEGTFFKKDFDEWDDDESDVDNEQAEEY